MIVTKELRAEIRQKREPRVQIGGKLVPGSVPFIRELLTKVNDPHDRDELLGELAGEYLRADLDDEHLFVQRERLASNPDAAVMWLGLAHSLAMRSDGAEEAKQAAARGVEISRRAGTLVRYSLTCQAQIARKVEDKALFERALLDLIEDAPTKREEDADFDESLINDLPAGFCSAGLIERYRSVIRSDSY